MSYDTNKEVYLELFESFIKRTVNVREYIERFTTMWEHDRDEQHAIADQWPERFDIQLIDALSSGRISGDEFDTKWVELWGYADYRHLLRLVDKAYTACDRYTTDPELLHEGTFYTADQLRDYTRDLVGEFLATEAGRDNSHEV